MKHVSEKRVNQFIELVNKEYKKNGESELFNKCVSVCRQTENIPFMIEFGARVKGVNAAAHFGKFVAENATAIQNLIFAQRVLSANKQLHLNVIAKSNDPKLCLNASKTLKGVDVSECQKVILEKGDYITIYEFARDVKNEGIDYIAIQEKIFKSNDTNLIYAFAMNCEGADTYACFIKLKELEASNEQCYNVYKNLTARLKLKIQLDEVVKDFENGQKTVSKLKREAIAYYAKDIFSREGKNQDLLECEDICIKLGNVDLLMELAKANIFDFNKLSKKISEVGNGLQNYEFMSYVFNWSEKNPNSEFDVDSIMSLNNKRILELGDAYACYLVAKNIHPANINEHENIVLNSKECTVNTAYAKDVKDADIVKHQKVVMKNGNVKDILFFIESVKGANLEEAYKCLQEKGADQKVLDSLEKKLNNSQKLNVIINEINK